MKVSSYENCYLYEGPVMEFDRCIQEYWSASTFTISEGRARSNLAFRFKKEHGRDPRSKITLPGKITIVE